MTDEKTIWPNGLPVVGQQASRTRTILESDIEMFTAISGDRNPLHYDEALASATKDVPKNNFTISLVQ
jgi:acyl dehydratase